MKKLLSLVLLFSLFLASPLVAGSVQIMDKDELKALLGSDNLVILDVRTGRDWSSSEFMVQDAIRVDGKDLTVAEKYPKDNTFVFYCA
ncbi:MAG: rhodanese-related sulfurtransferase [Desulforhopalus sp.]|jgi:rhodanese-related sulfurtransferase